MVNYGYTCEGWTQDMKIDFANALMEELDLDSGWTQGGEKPYLEVDQLYKGVRIRKLTNLSEDELKELVRFADVIKLKHDKMNKK